MFSNFEEILAALKGLPPGAMGGAMSAVTPGGDVKLPPSDVQVPQTFNPPPQAQPDPTQTASVPPQYASFANPTGPTQPGLTGQFPDAPGMLAADKPKGASAFGGLLKFKDEDEKQAVLRGLLGASGSLMAAGGPSDKPTSFLGNLGGAISNGVGFYEGAKDGAADRAYKNAQTARYGVANAQDEYKLKQAQAQETARQNYFKNRMGGGAGFDGGSNAGATAGPVAASGSPVAAPSAPTNDLAGQINRQRAQLDADYNFYASQGDSAMAGKLFDQMNYLDNQAAQKLLVWNGQNYTNAPGTIEGVSRSEYATKAAGQAGTESQVRTDDQRNYDATQSDTGFGSYLDKQADAKRQANRLQKEGAYIDPKSNARYSSTFDNATGNVIYKDGLNNVITDPVVINRLVQDTPGRTKANMSDPVVKDERTAEAALAQAAGRTAQTVGTVDRMQAIAGDINRNSWFQTGGYNGFAKTLDNVLPGDNFSGSKRQELDNLMQDQIKTEIESLRGLGAMSDRDLASIQDRVLNGNLNPAALKDIGDRLRGIAQYNAAKYEAWKGSGQTDDFRNWSYTFDKDNYEQFMSQGSGQSQPDQQPTGSTNTAAIPQISGVDDFQKLPSGTVYLDPQGVKRTKR
ncbi:hypothetical protein [Rhizobium sp. L43]|uniref:hypothetical protein n=1 Tax=Rhizobium sp. L43 TaxID=2035452 RepID=UPI000BE97554|nr:hypothetical protein [Rhizobium sp. L43]PDS75433.1 hypothetical protein CO667_26485 [Rhizobium sp. L43]